MSYLPPFEVVKKGRQVVSAKGKTYVNLEYGEFLELIRLMLRGVQVDEVWYFAAYPDVAEAVKSGTLKSAKHHFLESGYFEGRRPSEFEVDEVWYLKTYEDVAQKIKEGEISSATDHFATHGYSEGRFPTEF